jgi:glycosyltransferase involved in cell wall biosynthesis
VIIPSRNRRTRLIRTLKSLESQDLGPDLFEVVVVLDGTEDDSEAELHSLHPAHRLRWVNQPQGGLAAARNTGAHQASNELLVFYDDDMQADPGLVRAHLDAHVRHGDVIVQGFYPMAPEFLQGGTALAYDRSHRLAIATLETSLDAAVGIWGGNISVRRDTFFRVGGFDPGNFRDYGAEDTDFGLRAASAGVAVVLARDALAWHMRVCGYEGHRRLAFAEGRSLVTIERVHGRVMDALGGRGIGAAFDRVARVLWSLPTVAEGLGRFFSAGLWLADRALTPRAQLLMARLVYRHYRIGGIQRARLGQRT